MYSQWLQGLVNSDERLGRRYKKLLQALEAKEFTHFIPNDDNRLEDGKKLRHIFLNNLRTNAANRLQDDILDEPCSLLEMLIGVSIRFDENVISGDTESRLAEWFWMLIHNLGLLPYTSAEYNSERVENILNTFLARAYNRNGKGGLFPLIKPKKDQRKVEIWYQMQAYLDENYEI